MKMVMAQHKIPVPDTHHTPIFPPGTPPAADAWPRLRADLRARWDAVLGTDAVPPFSHAAELEEEFDLPEAHAAVYLIPTGPASRQRHRVRLAPP